MQELQEFFRFSTDIFNWRFFLILILVVTAAQILPDRYNKPFRSVKVNVWILFVIAVASAIGTFLPQNKPAEEAVAKFGAFWARLFDGLGFFDIYHTWWFSGLLAIMAFNVIVCKLRKLPALVMGPPKGESGNYKGTVSQFLSKATFKDQFQTSKSQDQIQGVIVEWLRENKYRFRHGKGFISSTARTKPPKNSNADVFYAGRQYFQRWGDFILHISLVIILAGNFLGALLGFEEAVPVMEGKSAKMENRPMEIHLKDFEIDYYESTGAPSVYASDLEIRENGEVRGQKRIVVNDPLDIDGIRFYQASWGMTDQIRSASIFILGRIVEFTQGKIKKLDGLPFSIRINTFAPTFDIDEKNRMVFRDFEGRNQALQMDFLENKKVIGRVWILKDRPQMAFRINGDHLEPTQPPPFRIASIDPILFSGIQIGYDPGASIFWVGSLILLFGLCIHFYMHQRRLRIVIKKQGSSYTIDIGGWNSRVPLVYKPEFTALTKDLKKRLY